MRKYMDILNEAQKGEWDEDGVFIQHDDDAADSMIDKSATPPEYEDKDAQHYEARRKTGFFGAQAAGCVLMAKTTGRIMIVLRSAAVDQPHTWGNCGGAFDASEERPIEAARREAHEETGYTGSVQMIPLYVFSKGDFRYSNFLAVVEDEFTPHLGWEADRAVWVNIGQWPKPLHFGLQALFGDAASMKTIKHYSEMFAKGQHAVEAVEEDLVLPAGLDVNKAIADGKDAKDALAADIEQGDLDPATPAVNGKTAAPDASGDAPAAAGATAAPGAPAAPTAPVAGQPQPKKNLAAKGSVGSQ